MRQRAFSLALLFTVALIAFTQVGCSKKSNPFSPNPRAGEQTTPPESTLPQILDVGTADGSGDYTFFDHDTTVGGVQDWIVIAFTEPMDKQSVESHISVQATFGRMAGSVVTGTVTYAKETRQATFIPETGFDDSTAYLVTVSLGAVDLEGNPLDGNRNGVAEGALDDFRANFRGPVYPSWANETDITPPQLALYLSPSPYSNSADITSDVRIYFSQSDIESSSVSNSTVLLEDQSGNRVQFGAPTFGLSSGTFYASLPYSSLSYGTVYTVTITTGVRDTAGNTLDGNRNGYSERESDDRYRWEFVTKLPNGGSSIPPGVLSSPTVVGGAVRLSFTKAMDASTFTTDKIRLFADADRTQYIPGTITPTVDGSGFTYSLENAPRYRQLTLFVSKEVKSKAEQGSYQFHLNNGGNPYVGGEEEVDDYTGTFYW